MNDPAATFPDLVAAQVAVAIAESSTGIIVDPATNERCFNGARYLVFESQSEAEAFSAAFIRTHEDRECHVLGAR